MPGEAQDTTSDIARNQELWRAYDACCGLGGTSVHIWGENIGPAGDAGIRFDALDVVIGFSWQEHFMRWIGAPGMPDDGERFLNLEPEALELSPVDAGILCSGARRVIDLRPGSGSGFEPADRTFLEGDGNLAFESGMAYTGKLPPAKANSIHRDHVWHILLQIRGLFGVLLRTDWDKMARLGEALMFGREQFSLPWRNCSLAHSYGAAVAPILMPEGDNGTCEAARQLYRLADIVRLWRRAVEIAIGERIPMGASYGALPEAARDSLIVSSLYEAHWLEDWDEIARVGEAIGAGAMVDTYYGGVPLEDVLA